MYLEIVSPEATLFGSDVESVVLPGINGEFQILKNHASIVSLLKEGTVKIHTENPMVLDELHADIVPQGKDNKVLTLKINSGTIEMKDNKIIVLVD
ncbi:F-type H+-transporting ATPase subunit epsilon [Mariniflexile fucanivorans]|uniref:F-type H+-transporting ATPase subunit epsilon n=1 Tax=Mariniflexile fucanivorans TaxID=264023 RepID=A0A4R1RRG3_9FLAO|nr:F0F1 ATP synthase subunit epsilon [Mariniflexile fucanivorans]TCL69013.1 F-type H+-transporting ATPase subunit epsilon [Mariniflexile fucanivorans]